MSADDILARASHALRQQKDGGSAEASRTRARVLSRVSSSARRGRLAVTLAPVAAVFALSTARASTQGVLPRAWSRVESFFAPERQSVKAATGDGRGSAAATRPAVVEAPGASREPVAPSVPEFPVDMLPVAAEPPPSARTLAGRAAPVEVRKEPVAEVLRQDTETSRLYADAHRAHFVDRDPAVALRAWDAYLLVAPEGPLVPEARYNRALALVRLARYTEARRALEAFADGEYGGYRAHEARELIEAMGGR